MVESFKSAHDQLTCVSYSSVNFIFIWNLYLLFSSGTGYCDENVNKENGMDYIGCQSKTVNGRTCQYWNTNFPHKSDYPFNMNHNFCRNPNGEKDYLWCYTIDPDVEWEYCESRSKLSFNI